MSLYVVPVLLGLSGILFAQRLEAFWLRDIALLLSVMGPTMAAGYILANVRSHGTERLLLLVGILVLMLWAIAAASGLLEGFVASEEVSRRVGGISHSLGFVSLLLGLLAIVSAVVRTDVAIEELGARFRHLADHMGEGFILAGADGTVAMANQRFLELTGLAESDVVGSDLREIAQTLNGEIMLPQLEQRMRGQASEYRCTWVVKGEERHFLISGKPLFNRRGNLAGALATVRDITEQHNLAKRLERYTHGLQKLVEDRTEKLRQSEERFRNLLLHMSEGFLTVDESFRIRFANERICEVLHVQPEALTDRKVFDFVEAPGRGRLLELFETARLREDQATQQEFTFLAEDGPAIPVMVAIAPVQAEDEPDDDAVEARYSLVVTDISELKRMQHQLEVRANELQNANEELKMLDRAKDGFLSNVSHELKTPLATIRGYVEMLSGGSLGSLAEQQLNALTVMNRNAQRLGLLIEEMIEFSRMQIRGIQLSMGLHSVRTLLQESAASIQPQAGARDIEVHVTVEKDLPVAWADRKRVAQVLAILLSNAVKFSHHGGSIELRAAARTSDTLILSVEDHGIGIPSAFHQRVFDKFFQVDSSHTRRYEGAGIGLSIAKNIVEAHGGTIELSSSPGVGSTFTLFMPRAIFDTQYRTDASKRLEGLRVIVAEDDEDSRRALSGVLERSGAAVTVVRSGHECVRASRETAPGLIVLGEMMPDLSGVATYRKLREEIGLDDVPVILVVSPGRPRAPFEAGPSTPFHLIKPFTAAELVATVREACFQDISGVGLEPPEPVERRHERGSVLAIDSDSDFLAWLKAGLRHRQIECSCALDIREAIDVATDCEPDLVLVDIDAANGNAAEFIGQLKEATGPRKVPFYVITGLPLEYYGPLDVAGGLRKPFTIEDVVDIVLGPRVQS